MPNPLGAPKTSFLTDIVLWQLRRKVIIGQPNLWVLYGQWAISGKEPSYLMSQKIPLTELTVKRIVFGISFTPEMAGQVLSWY